MGVTASQAMQISQALVVLISAFALSAHSSRVVTVTGATGRTGSTVYLALKKQNFTVRALVRNVSKARTILGCDKCTAEEGIFVGDVKDAASMHAAMDGADTLVITTGPAYHCLIPSIYIGCKYYDGADPEAMSWKAVRAQVSAFANTSRNNADRHVVLTSNDLTTLPDNFLDKIDNGFGCFYALNGEAFLMSSGVPFTIIKPNGLGGGDAGKQEIVVAHDDEGWKPTDLNYEFIARSDVARLLTFAAANPKQATGLRFDVTSKKSGGTPTTDISTVFPQAMEPWDPRLA